MRAASTSLVLQPELVILRYWKRAATRGNGEDKDVSALQHYRTPDGLAPGPGYSHAVTGRGRWVATAGQVAIDDSGKVVGAGDIEAQTRQVFVNLSRALAAAGASFADVIKLNF